MVQFRFCGCYETRLRSCLGWVNVLVSEGAGRYESALSFH